MKTGINVIANLNVNKCLLAITIITIISSISNITFSQGRRDFDKTQYPPYNPFDTTTVYTYGDTTTTTTLPDSLRMPIDSTARLKYFTYEPDYNYNVQLKEKSHPLLLGNSSYIKYDVKFTDDNKVIIRKLFNGEDVQVPLELTMEQYLSNLEEYTSHQIYSDLFSEKYKGVTQDELSELFQKFTDITIPIPGLKSETIFGPPTINLRINGAIDITASFQNIKSDVESTTGLNNQNNLNFKQDVQVTAKGKVGDKLTIDADWNTQRVFDFENQLKIKYEGYEDEVIKKLEAGNVSLETRSSLIQSSLALFGLKGEFQLGPLSLSTVVSQKKSKSEERNYVGGILEQQINLKAWEYSENHYFFDTSYKSSFVDFFDNDDISSQTLSKKILTGETELEVWVQTLPTTSERRDAVATIGLKKQDIPGGYDPNTIAQDSLESFTPSTGRRFGGFFRKLLPTEYKVYPEAGFLSITTSIDPTFVVGVAYTTQNGDKFGTTSLERQTGTLILKMIKADVVDPIQTPFAWEHRLKNIYRLPVSDVIKDGFQLQAKLDVNGVLQNSLPGDQTSLSTRLEIDRFGENRSPGPDEIFDFIPGKTINPESGDIIFPSLQPFKDRIQSIPNVDSTLVYSDIYTKNKTNAATSPLANRYYLIGKAKGESGNSNVINLGFNVVPNSVKVFIGAQELALNVDYTVDYTTGTVIIKNAAALLSPDLKLVYDTNELLSLASKTFLGLRGDYRFDDKNSIGFTFVNLKQETLNDKVRIGEEPTNNAMFGIDFQTEFKPKFLTNLVNMLPGYNTKEESAFTLKGEFAYITPDPNTLKSRIPQDNNESIAYVDDMEGSKKTLSLGTQDRSWTISSLPITDAIGHNDTVKQRKRGKLRWYNISNDTEISEVYPERSFQPGQNLLTSFTMSFDPNQRGAYSYNAKFDTTTKATNWNGIMKYLNTTATDLITENINFIELNMKISTINAANLQTAKLVIDLGKISEDAIPNGKLDTEDRLQRGSIDPSDDNGLDSLTDAEEQDLWRLLNPLDTVPSDPAGDNFVPSNPINYEVINGTQGNIQLEGGNRPDTEDLNKNGVLTAIDSYRQYELMLDTTNNQYISGRGAPGSGWYQYRIPLSEFKRIINNGTLSDVQYARVWITGVTDSTRIQIVDFNLVGNQWEKPNKTDTTYNISVINIEENSQIYQPPIPGNVLRQEIRNSTGANTLSNEQSLAISVDQLSGGVQKFAVKNYQNQFLNLSGYKSMKLFVNGDPTFNFTSVDDFDAYMVIRFGNDSNNYYEYKAPIHPDVRPGSPWNPLNEVTIDFAELTAIKINRDSSGTYFNVPNGPPGATYSVKGEPSIRSIRQFVLGVQHNNRSSNGIITGSVWFNEIRLLNVEDDNGYAFNLNAGVKFADLLDVNMNLSKRNTNFNSLDGRAINRNNENQVAWDIGGTLNVHKIFNNAIASAFGEQWKDFLYIPLTFRHSEGLVKPRYYPGSDIELEKAAEQKFNEVLALTGSVDEANRQTENLKIQAQTLEVRNDFGINGMQLRFPGDNYIVKNVLNKLVYNFNASFGSSRDVLLEKRNTYEYRGSLEFQTEFGLSDKLHLNIGNLINLGDQFKNAKLYFALPFIPLAPLFSQNFAASTDFDRARDEKKQRINLTDDPVSRRFGANRGFGFDWKFIEGWVLDLTGNYRVKIGSDLTGFETYNDSLRSQRPEGEVLDNIFLNDALINFGRDFDYAQTTTFNPRINIPFLSKFMDLTGNYSSTYLWRDPISAINRGYDVGYQTSMSANATLRLKEIFGIFGSSNSLLGAGINDDSSRSGQSIGDIFKIFKTLIPDNINVTFSQQNRLLNSGVVGRPGFGNFWMMPTTKEEYGPSRAYQLGLNTFPGKRVPGLTNVIDLFNIGNELAFSTTISPIFPEAIRMNLTFRKKWGFENGNTYNTNDGVSLQQIGKTGNFRNSITTFFTGDIDEFRYEPTGADDDKHRFTDAFKSELSSFPFPNWNMTISGVEKFPFFAQFAQLVTIENNYISEISEISNLDPLRGENVPSTHVITQRFEPLFGINFTFKEVLGGNMTSNIRINSSKAYTLSPLTNLISATQTNEWSVNAQFTKQGFEIPLFGLSLKNDIAFSLTVSRSMNAPADYRFLLGDDIPQKVEGIGSNTFTVNPSIQYSLSSKVQMQLFFKSIKTESLGAYSPPRTNSEGGLNIRISLQ